MIDEILKDLNRQPGKHYRMVNLNPANIARKKYKGYSPVTGSSAEVKGTPLEKHVGADGLVRIGNSVLASTPEDKYRENREKVRAKTALKLRSIKRAYLEEEENIKRKLGKAHKGVKFIHRTED